MFDPISTNNIEYINCPKLPSVKGQSSPWVTNVHQLLYIFIQIRYCVFGGVAEIPLIRKTNLVHIFLWRRSS